MEEATTNLYASVGEQLAHYQVDVENTALIRRAAVTLPANVQYAWPHPSRRYLYVASSDRVRGELGKNHTISTFRIADDGALEQAGDPLSLPYRPIHVTVDASGQWLAVTFNNAGSKRGPGGNKLCVHELDDTGTVSAASLFTKTTLADDANGRRVRQLVGTVHVHPRGTHAYVANRADGVVRVGEADVYEGGENNIAVFRLDGDTGEPTMIQHVDTRGITPRTFAMDPTGRLLIVGNQVTRRARDGDSVTTIPVSLAVFRVLSDGRLEYVRKYDLETGKKTLFWMGLV